MRLSFTVPGPPVPKHRARVVRDMWGKARGITPAKTKGYEQNVAMRALVARSHVKGWSLDGHFRVDLEVRRLGTQGDLDNIIKSALDACNGIVWIDDVQVVEIHAKRVPVGDVGEQLAMSVEHVQ